jgi:hypothetical protein
MKYAILLSMMLSFMLIQCKSSDISEQSKNEVRDTTEQVIDSSEQTNIILFDTLRLALSDTMNIELRTYFSTGKLWQVNEKDSVLTVNIKDTFKKVDGKIQDFQILKVTTQKKGQFKMQVENKRPFGKQEGERTIKNYLFIVE